MRFTDFLKATVLLTAGEATALGAVTVVAASTQRDTTAIIVSVAAWVAAGAIGAWTGRRIETTTGIASLLANARTESALPEIRPGAVLLNRLWPLGVYALIAAGLSWLYPQVAGVATAFLILFTLAWRKQEKAVTAIEERDGVRFYVARSSPLRRIRLARTIGYPRLRSLNGGHEPL